MEFNLQEHLETMRREQREDAQSILNAFSGHEKLDAERFQTIHVELAKVGVVQGLAKWAAATLIVVLLGVMADLIVNHFGAERVQAAPVTKALVGH